MEIFGTTIAGTGSYAPSRVLTNHDLEAMVETSDEWIQTRTGIRQRHIAEDDEPTSAIAHQAAVKAVAAAGIEADDLDLIIVATSSPDTIFPNTGCHLQRRMGAQNAACFALEAACSGFLYAFKVGCDMIRCNTFRNALIVGAEKMSMHVDWTDRTTCVLFGDGAGALVLQQTSAEDDCLIADTLGSDGNYAGMLQVPAGGSAIPQSHEAIEKKQHFLKMNGREVFRLAVNSMVSAAEEVLARADLDIEQLRWLVPHQANARILTSVGAKLGIPEEKVFMNVDHYGNTSAATIPIAIDEIVNDGKIERDEYMLLTAFGAGLTWGAELVRW